MRKPQKCHSETLLYTTVETITKATEAELQKQKLVAANLLPSLPTFMADPYATRCGEAKDKFAPCIGVHVVIGAGMCWCTLIFFFSF